MHTARPRVHCFEPQPDVFAMLAHNVTAALPSSRLYCLALTDAPRTLTYRQNRGNVGATTLSSPGSGDGGDDGGKGDGDREVRPGSVSISPSSLLFSHGGKK